MKWQFARINKFIPYLIFLGIALGFAEVFMGSDYNTIQIIIVHIITTLIIGYTILFVLFNHEIVFLKLKKDWQRYIALCAIFVSVALVASEIEILIRNVVFKNQAYSLFSGGNMYIFNAIITTTIGLGSYFTLRSNLGIDAGDKKKVTKVNESDDGKTNIDRQERINQIPLKQGENIFLIDIHEISIFEAFDNYALAFDKKGSKRICDFSLLFLEKKLDKNFLRIHRKHIINKKHISKIQAHLNGRFVIEMKNGIKVHSSKTYAPVIKSIIKLS